MSHYDRQADIAWLLLEGYDGRRAYGEDHQWGLVERDRETGQVVAFEVWQASQHLPRELLDALPQPEGRGVIVERTPDGLNLLDEPQPA